VRADLVTAQRLDCTDTGAGGGCSEFSYTAYLDQYLVEIVMSRPRELKVGQLSPVVDLALDQIDRRIGP
jgi:hypothetical protein